MTDALVRTLADIDEFLKGTTKVTFEAPSKPEAYTWIRDELIRFDYIPCSKVDKGKIQKYLKKVTGYSKAQLKRLIKQYVATGKIELADYERHTFPSTYTNQDIITLAKTDDLHDYPNGQALATICRRMFEFFHDQAFVRLQHISSAHIYTLRHHLIYLKLNRTWDKTKPSVENGLGVREKPEPNGQPGYIEIDTIHQGDDEDGTKGVYHIHGVDMVTQWDIVIAVEKISEDYLLPVLKLMLELFPFKIIAFHADNGSEYINHTTVNLLNKLLIRLLKSRSREPNDNALVESKNKAIVRKYVGYWFIPKGAAKILNDFFLGIFTEYLNYHRPCGFPTIIISPKGKEKKVYRKQDYQTPYQKLKSLPEAAKYLKPGITFQQLDKIANRLTDNQAAKQFQTERNKFFNQLDHGLY